MNRNRIIEILESYRPGEGLEADPEVREALELAREDPELAALRREMELFDAEFGARIREIKVPESLSGDILAAAAAREKPTVASPASPPRSNILSWIHPAAFAAAAAIVLLLALSFTFWNRPQPAPVPAQLALADPLTETAHGLYASMNPSFRSRNGEKIREYLQNQGNVIPVGLPSGFAWDKTFACDVLDVDGKKVSLVCFSSPDGTDKLHLFTFYRDDFPEIEIPLTPQIRKVGEACSATWCNDEQIHVLYSDSGDTENLRRILDI